MKAISIRQPLAWLILQGFKPVENRTWETLYRGTLIIHASQGMARAEYEECSEFLWTRPTLRHISHALPAPHGMPAFLQPRIASKGTTQ